MLYILERGGGVGNEILKSTKTAGEEITFVLVQGAPIKSDQYVLSATNLF